MEEDRRAHNMPVQSTVSDALEADYAKIESRVLGCDPTMSKYVTDFANFLQLPADEVIKYINDGIDMITAATMVTHGIKDRKLISPALRNLIKTRAFGWLYGASPERMAGIWQKFNENYGSHLYLIGVVRKSDRVVIKKYLTYAPDDDAARSRVQSQQDKAIELNDPMWDPEVPVILMSECVQFESDIYEL